MKSLATIYLLFATSIGVQAAVSPTTNAPPNIVGDIIRITPNTIGSGNIPGNYQSKTVVFLMADGDWAPKVTLAAVACDGCRVLISSSAAYGFELDTSKTDIPVPSLTLSKGVSLMFVFNAAQGRWIYTSKTYSPLSSGANVPADFNQTITSYKMWDGNWAPAVALPSTAPNGAMVMISSAATWTSRIDPGGILYASTLGLRTGDVYLFMYRTDLARWVAVAAPKQTLPASTVGPVLPTPIVPTTVVSFANGVWRPGIELPAMAGNRDRVVLQSNATWPVAISNKGVEFQGTMTLQTGQRYEFMYIQEKRQWVLQYSPKKAFTPVNGRPYNMPAQTSPVMEYASWDGVWAPRVTLPTIAKPGDQVVVKSNATWGFDVTTDASRTPPVRIDSGDTVRFVRAADNSWQRQTNVITMLLVYSEQAVAQLGEWAMKLRLLEGLRLTNEALENSQANFYVKPAGLLKRQLPGGTLNTVLEAGLTDTIVQAQRKVLAANTVYYEGTEQGCGLGYVGPNPAYMIGAGSLSCGTTVMRHEFGHNMGLSHNDATPAVLYARGYAVVRDIMGGNAIPYYSNPKLYTPDLGLPMGVENSVDSVRALNEQSAAVAKYR